VERWDGVFELVTWTAETAAGEDDEALEPAVAAAASAA
jgi:hypothetical protein